MHAHLEDLHAAVDHPAARVAHKLEFAAVLRAVGDGCGNVAPPVRSAYGAASFVVRNAHGTFRNARSPRRRKRAARLGTHRAVSWAARPLAMRPSERTLLGKAEAGSPAIAARPNAAGSCGINRLRLRLRQRASRRSPIGRPPYAVGTRQLVENKRLTPCVRPHDLRLERGHGASMRGIERLVRNALGVGPRIHHGDIAGTRALVAPHLDILHARHQVLRIVFRQADALVLLGVGQAGVHRQCERRIVPSCVERIGLSRLPRRFERQQKPAASRRPQRFVQLLAAWGEQRAVLAQRIARHQLSCGTCAQLVGCSFSLHHTVGLKALRAALVQHVANRIHLLAHGVGHHGEPPAHTRNLGVPRHRVERRHAHQAHAQRRGDALRRGHGDAHARERPRPAPHAHACDVRARHAQIGQNGIDARHQLGVRRPARFDFHRCRNLDRTRFGTQHAHAEGDHLVGGVERKHVPSLPGRVFATRILPDHANPPAHLTRRDLESFAHTVSRQRARSPKA